MRSLPLLLVAVLLLSTIHAKRPRSDGKRPRSNGRRKHVLAAFGDQLQIPALGEAVSLGMGYDEVEERFVSGVSLLRPELIAKHRTETRGENSAFEVTTDDSIEAKRRHFDLNVEMSAKLSLGIASFSAHGAAKYIEDHRVTTNTARLVLNYKSRSGTETLTLSELSDTAFQQVAIDAGSTHVVTGIHYGAEAFLLFDRREVNTSSRRSTEVGLHAALNYALFSGSMSGSTNVTEEQWKRVRSSAVKFYGDVLLDTNPTTFDEAVAVYKNLSALIKAVRTRPDSSLFGVPQIVTLTPLSVLRLNVTRKRRARLSDSTSARISRVVQRSFDLSANLEDLVDYEGVYAQLPDEAREEIDTVRDLTAAHIADFRSQMSDLLPQFAVGNVTERRVLQELVAFEKSTYFSGVLRDYIDRKECEFVAFAHYFDALNRNARPAYDYNSISELTLASDVDYVIAFSLSDILTRRLNAESALLNGTPLADSWCGSSRIAFADKLKKAVQVFADLAAENAGGAAQRTRYVYTQSKALPQGLFAAGHDSLGQMAIFGHGNWRAPYWPEGPPIFGWNARRRVSGTHRHIGEMQFYAMNESMVPLVRFLSRKEGEWNWNGFGIRYDGNLKFETTGLDLYKNARRYTFKAFYQLPEGRSFYSPEVRSW